jgi:hypothetical protein
VYNFGVHIVHATIADLITVFLLKNVVKFVVGRKMFVKLGRENYVLCWFNTLTEKRVKPNDADIRFVFSIAEVESDTRSKKFPILAVNLPLL